MAERGRDIGLAALGAKRDGLVRRSAGTLRLDTDGKRRRMHCAFARDTDASTQAGHSYKCSVQLGLALQTLKKDRFSNRRRIVVTLPCSACCTQEMPAIDADGMLNHLGAGYARQQRSDPLRWATVRLARHRSSGQTALVTRIWAQGRRALQVLLRESGGNDLVERPADPGEMLEQGSAQRALRSAKGVHGVMEATEAECMAATVNDRLEQELCADDAREIGCI